MPVRVHVEIDSGAANAPSHAVNLVEFAVRTILRREGFTGKKSASVTVLLTDDARLRQLNRDFAGDDHTTDVLSFEAQRDDGFPLADFEGIVDSIGDIAISVAQTERQAGEKGVPFERELAMLAIHGTLHLLGYDHASPAEERVMFGKTDEALGEIFETDS